MSLRVRICQTETRLGVCVVEVARVSLVKKIVVLPLSSNLEKFRQGSALSTPNLSKSTRLRPFVSSSK